MTAIVDSHFPALCCAHVIRLVTTTFGGNVHERLIEISQKFELCLHGGILPTIARLARVRRTIGHPGGTSNEY